MSLSRGKIDRQPISVLVYEDVTGGGLIGQSLPESWAVEGGAMRRVIARDFAAVPDTRVTMILDGRLPREEISGLFIRLVLEGEVDVLPALAAKVDYTLAIAPETDGALSRLAGRIVEVGGRSLGSHRRAIEMTGDKARLAHHFVESGIPTPQTWIIGPGEVGLPNDWDGPMIVKPRFGAGSVETVIVRDRRRPDWVRSDQSVIVQPYLTGRPMSASFLVDIAGRATLLGVGRQRIEIDLAGRISYQGGTILSKIEAAPQIVEAALDSVNDRLGTAGLRGFVGVDYLDDPLVGITILEINPRPTTSYVGLSRMLGPGMIAGAWLDAMDRPLAQTEWLDRFRGLRQGQDVTFDPDGTIVSED